MSKFPLQSFLNTVFTQPSRTLPAGTSTQLTSFLETGNQRQPNATVGSRHLPMTLATNGPTTSQIQKTRSLGGLAGSMGATRPFTSTVYPYETARKNVFDHFDFQSTMAASTDRTDTISDAVLSVINRDELWSNDQPKADLQKSQFINMTSRMDDRTVSMTCDWISQAANDENAMLSDLAINPGAIKSQQDFKQVMGFMLKEVLKQPLLWKSDDKHQDAPPLLETLKKITFLPGLSRTLTDTGSSSVNQDCIWIHDLIHIYHYQLVSQKTSDTDTTTWPTEFLPQEDQCFHSDFFVESEVVASFISEVCLPHFEPDYSNTMKEAFGVTPQADGQALFLVDAKKFQDSLANDDLSEIWARFTILNQPGAEKLTDLEPCEQRTVSYGISDSSFGTAFKPVIGKMEALFKLAVTTRDPMQYQQQAIETLSDPAMLTAMIDFHLLRNPVPLDEVKEKINELIPTKLGQTALVGEGSPQEKMLRALGITKLVHGPTGFLDMLNGLGRSEGSAFPTWLNQIGDDNYNQYTDMRQGKMPTCYAENVQDGVMNRWETGLKDFFSQRNIDVSQWDSYFSHGSSQALQQVLGSLIGKEGSKESASVAFLKNDYHIAQSYTNNRDNNQVVDAPRSSADVAALFDGLDEKTSHLYITYPSAIDGKADAEMTNKILEMAKERDISVILDTAYLPSVHSDKLGELELNDAVLALTSSTSKMGAYHQRSGVLFMNPAAQTKDKSFGAVSQVSSQMKWFKSPELMMQGHFYFDHVDQSADYYGKYREPVKQLLRASLTSHIESALADPEKREALQQVPDFDRWFCAFKEGAELSPIESDSFLFVAIDDTKLMEVLDAIEPGTRGMLDPCNTGRTRVCVSPLLHALDSIMTERVQNELKR